MRQVSSYTPSIDFDKASTKVLGEYGKLSVWFTRTAISIIKRDGTLTSEALKIEMLGDLYHLYFFGNKRRKSAFPKDVEAAIIVMIQRNSEFDMIVALKAYKVIRKLDEERCDVPKIYKQETAEYITELTRYKLLNSSKLSDKQKEGIEEILCGLL